MKENSSFKYQIGEVHARFFFIILLSVLLPLMFNPNWTGKEEAYWIRALISLMYTATMWNGGYFIITRFRKKYPTIHQTSKRITLSLSTTILYVFMANFALYYTCALLLLLPFKSPLIVIIHGYINYGISIFIIAIYESVYFFQQWRESKLETERLKTQQIRSQFEVLKNQVSPHFLFNSLNTLMSLIPEDPRIALTFTEKLSEVYRYILQQKDAELVSLQTELAFVRSFIFLLQMRFEDALHIHWRIDEELMETSIAPLTAQMLVENAVKHNIVSHDKPLTIEIIVEDEELIVRNNLQKKRMVHSTGIGLQNIQNQYRYLTKKTVKLTMDDKIFEVRLPLLYSSEKLQKIL